MLKSKIILLALYVASLSLEQARSSQEVKSQSPRVSARPAISRSSLTPSVTSLSGKGNNNAQLNRRSDLHEANSGTVGSSNKKDIQRSDSNDESGDKFQGGSQHNVADSSYSYPATDLWHHQNLMPTLVDQEQGDDMVAMASDQEGQLDQIKMGPQTNISSQPTDSLGPIETSEGRIRGQFQSNQDIPREYFTGSSIGDEDEEDEDDETTIGGFVKPKPASDSDSSKGSHSGSEYRGQYMDDSYSKVPRSRDRNVGSAHNQGWQLLASDQNSNSAKRQTRPKGSINDGSTRSIQAGKLAQVFSGRDTLSKTDAAIEYLKNMLKDRQNASNSSISANSSSTGQTKAQIDRNPNPLLKLSSSIASKLSNIFGGNTTNLGDLSHQSKYNSSRFIQRDVTLATKSPPRDAGDFIGQKGAYSGTKFSIEDAKPTPNMYQIETSSTTRMPPSAPPARQSFPSIEPTQSSKLIPLTRNRSQDTLLPMGAANGTPLGGDYVESLDDYPRNHPAVAEIPSHLQEQFPQAGPSPDKLMNIYRPKQPSEPIKASASSLSMNTTAYRQETPSSQLNRAMNSATPQVKSKHESRHVAQANDRLTMKSLRNELGQLPAEPSAIPVPLELPSLPSLSPSPSTQSPLSAQQRQPQMGSSKSLGPPRIIRYNYMATQSDTAPTNFGHESELSATNYQLGDALYSSTGTIEQTLSPSELNAIQSQFLTADHSPIPMSGTIGTSELPVQTDGQAVKVQQVDDDLQLNDWLSKIRPSNQQPESLQKLISSHSQVEDELKELASNDGLSPASIVAPPSAFSHLRPVAHRNPPSSVDVPRIPIQPPSIQRIRGAGSSFNLRQEHQQQRQMPSQILPRLQSVQPARATQMASSLDDPKRKSLIVYLNHPRPVDMSGVTNEGYNPAPPMGVEPNSYVSAKEIDSHGIASSSKNLDLRSLKAPKDDKDGLSVVVIGDAYKYKKIVLLISSKSGGLKFIPIVKDMKK